MILYGRDFGTGIAANLASSVNVKTLELESPYYSIPYIFSSYFPIYPMQSMANCKFPVGEHLKDVQCPVTIFHGTVDEVIPVKSSMKLKASLKKNDQFLLIENGKHNDLSSSEVYKKTMTEILK